MIKPSMNGWNVDTTFPTPMPKDEELCWILRGNSSMEEQATWSCRKQCFYLTEEYGGYRISGGVKFWKPV